MGVQHLSPSQVHAIHIATMEAEGWPPQPLVREELLDSAVNRVRWAEAYEDLTVPQLAVRLATAIALAHAFTDGNKRTALQDSVTFLELNGYALPTEAVALDYAKRLEALVATPPNKREAEEQCLADWLTEHVVSAE